MNAPSAAPAGLKSTPDIRLLGRRAGDESEEIHRGIHMSINGVSAGLRNSG